MGSLVLNVLSPVVLMSAVTKANVSRANVSAIQALLVMIAVKGSVLTTVMPVESVLMELNVVVGKTIMVLPVRMNIVLTTVITKENVVMVSVSVKVAGVVKIVLSRLVPMNALDKADV